MARIPLRIGIVGAGRIAEAGHVPGFLAAGAAVASLCARDAGRLGPLVERTGARVFTDWREMLRTAGLNAVSICTPPDLHAEIAIASLNEGLHVLVEKPVTATLADCDALARAERDTDRIVMAAHNQRFRSQHRIAREIVASGRIGRPIRAHAVFGHGGPELWSPHQTWYFDARRAGHGVLLDLGYHKLDLLRWILGADVTDIRAFGATASKPTSADDNAVAIVEFSSGTLATIQVSWTHRPGVPDSTTIVCERGVVSVPSAPDQPVAVTIDGPDGVITESHPPQTGDGPGWVPMVRAFVQAIETGAPSPVTISDARETLRAILSAYETMGPRNTHKEQV